MKEQKKPRHSHDCSAYKLWDRLIQKTTNPRHKQYKNFGLRGVKMCKAWRESSIAFMNAIRGLGYVKGTTLKLIDKNGDITPGNVRVVSVQSALNAKRKKPMCQGREIEVKEVAKDLKIHLSTVYYRIKNNWPYWKIIISPPRSTYSGSYTKKKSDTKLYLW